MTKVGEWPVQRNDGDYEFVDIHEPGTFDHDPLLVQLNDGSWGTPYLKPLGEGDTGVLVQANDGTWWQVNEEGILLLEDWESEISHDRWNWPDTDFSGEMMLTTDSVDGTHAVRFDGFRSTAAMPGYPDPAPHLPLEVGDTLQFHFKFPHYNDIDGGEQYWFVFLLQDAPHYTTTSAGDVDWDRFYTVEAVTGSNDLFRFSRREGGTRYPYTGDGRATVDWQAGVWYRAELAIWTDGFGCDLYRYLGGSTWDFEATILGPAPKWTSGGIGIRSSGNNGESLWDLFRKIP